MVKWGAALLLVLAMVLCCSFSVFAFGGDVDTGGGGDSGGWGGGGDSGGSWDSGSSGGSGGNSSTAGVLFTAFFGFAVISHTKRFWQHRQSQKPQNSPEAHMLPTPVHQENLAVLKREDPTFDAKRVEDMVRGWVHDFETAWCAGDMTPCRASLSPNRFETYQDQLETMRRQKTAARTEGLKVLACTVTDWQRDGGAEFLDVWILEKKRTWTVSLEKPGVVVEGKPGRVYTLAYHWLLTRPAGSKQNNWVLAMVTKLGQTSR